MSGLNIGCVSTGNKTGDANAAFAGPALLHGAKLLGGTADSRLKIYNAATVALGAVETLVWELSTNAGTNVGDVTDQVVFETPISCPNGISFDVSGTAAEYYGIAEELA